MQASILAQLADLERLSTAALTQRWRELMGSAAPVYGRRLLIRRLAYRIQELAYGGLSPESRLELESLVEGRGGDPASAIDADLAPRGNKQAGLPKGTRLVREYGGKRHEVLVGEGGFEFEGRSFRSLSAIAREITGTRWNGPAFFGLREGKRKEGRR